MNETKSAVSSKINWTQIIAVLAMAASLFGFDLDTETQAALAISIQSVAAAVTVIWRTWFTSAKIA